MIAEPLALLSERPLEVPTRTGLGDRFRYFRGISGRRYLFTRIDVDEVANFRSAVVVLARREPRGLRALSVGDVDANGRLAECTGWPQIVPHDGVMLVHLLAEKPEVRQAIVADLVRATPTCA